MKRREVLGALGAIGDAMDMVPVAPHEGEVEDGQLRGDAAPDGRARTHEVDQAFLQLLDDLALLAECAARKDADRHGPGSRPLGRLLEEPGEAVKRGRARRHRMRQAEDQGAGP